MLTNTPDGAKSAMILMDGGPAGLAQNWDGFDMLMLVNLTDQALDGPQMGAGAAGYGMDALGGGFANDFGGLGPTYLSDLPAHGVYVTLVPEGISQFTYSFERSDIPWATADTLAYGQPLYDSVPEPATLGLLGVGLAGLMARRRKQAEYIGSGSSARYVIRRRVEPIALKRLINRRSSKR